MPRPTACPDDQIQLLPWALPKPLYYLTPWAWVRAYLRVGDALLFRLWFASRPFMWALEDRVLAMDARIIEEARAMSSQWDVD